MVSWKTNRSFCYDYWQ